MLEYLNGAVRFWGGVGDKIANEFEYSILKGNAPQQLENTRERLFGTDPNAVAAGKFVQNIADQTPIGVAEQGAAILGGNAAETVGAPRVVGEVLGGLAVPGSQVPSVQTATKAVVKNGSVRLLQTLPAEPAQALTIKNPDFLAKGVTQGIASGSDFGPAMTKWRNRRMELREQMRNPKGLTAKRRAANAAASKEVAYNDVSTGPNTDPLDVEAYGRKNYKVKGMEQHHLFPKKESYEFVEKMLKVGDEDDVLNLFLYAEELDAVMGGRLSNILNMNIPPHKQLHNNRIKDGRQLKGVKLFNKVDQAKNADEVMEMFDEYIINNIQPSKAEAKQLQKAFEQAKNKMNTFNSLTEAQRRRL